MTLHPLTSKGGAFVLKLGLVFKDPECLCIRDLSYCLFTALLISSAAANDRALAAALQNTPVPAREASFHLTYALQGTPLTPQGLCKRISRQHSTTCSILH